jgi:hypothetical protein
MTREQFLELVKNPAQPISTESIASLTGQFPYCQPLRYLYLKNLAETESVQYPQQLKITAAVSPDRTRLFRFIHPEPSTVQADDMIAGVYADTIPDASSSTHEADSMLSAGQPFEEPSTSLSTETIEYEAPQEETRMSVEEIVNQRLKELNLWQEPEDHSAPIVEVINMSRDQPTDTDEEVQPVTTELPVFETPENDMSPAPLPDEEINEETIAETEQERNDEVKEDDKAMMTVEQVNPEQSAEAESAANTDPLEEIIQESLLETRLRNADYFDNHLPAEPNITAEISSVSDIPSTPHEAMGNDETAHKASTTEESLIPENPAPEKYTLHTGESHSFTEWLQLNRTTPASTTPPVITGDIHAKEAAEEPAIAEVLVTAASHLATSGTPEPQPEAAVTAPETGAGSLTAGLSENKETGNESRTISGPGIRFLYVKSGNAATMPAAPPDSHIGRVAAELANTPTVTPPIPSPAKQTSGENHATEAISVASTPISVAPAAADPLEADPTKETIFTGEIIPPRKPIPDPSLVDTDPPKPRIPGKELIEKFIREEPRITPSKSTFYSPSNMAKKSVIEPDDLVTETLASIYAQQGNYQKAINFYQKLSLKFPEKSRYFAALIEELNKKSNS